MTLDDKPLVVVPLTSSSTSKLTDYELKLCEFALSMVIEYYQVGKGQFLTLRDKLIELGYEYK